MIIKRSIKYCLERICWDNYLMWLWKNPLCHLCVIPWIRIKPFPHHLALLECQMPNCFEVAVEFL